jgi:hypothetical protein
MSNKLKFALGTASVLSLTALAANAAVVDLINGNTGNITTANYGTSRFDYMDQQPTGTGVIDPFLRIQRNGTEQGYNTSGVNPQAPFDDKAGIWTHDLRMSDLDVVTIGSQTYFKFLLDINEDMGSRNELLSLDRLQIYTTSVGSQTTMAMNNANTVNQTLGLQSAQLRYSLDDNVAGIDNTVNLDYSRNQGSGSGDMIAYIPTSLFAGAGQNDFVVLYSQFGATYAANTGLDTSDGFEEWWVLRSQPIPEPATVLSGLFLMVGLCWMERGRVKGLVGKLHIGAKATA